MNRWIGSACVLTWCSRACSRSDRRGRSTCTTRRVFDDTRRSVDRTRASRRPGRRAACTGRGSDVDSPHRRPSSRRRPTPLCRHRSPSDACRSSHPLYSANAAHRHILTRSPSLLPQRLFGLNTHTAWAGDLCMRHE